METKTLNPQPQSQSPSSSGRRSSNDYCNSPEFEFWRVRNPSFPQPDLLSADELFVDGVLLPLHLLSVRPKSDPPDQTPQSGPLAQDPGPEPDPGHEISASVTGSMTAALSASKRWRDIFKRSNKKSAETNSPEEKEREKGKKKERKSGGGGSSSSAELNINIWPFSRSRSAGNAGTRPGLFPGAPATRRVNSAPCSRSNSAGESKSRKWTSSPGRAGVHLGRSSPVWQVRRSKNPGPNAEKASNISRRSKAASTAVAAGGGSARARVLNLNVPMCIGYKQHLSCRSDENSAICAGGTTKGAAPIRGGNGGGNGGAGNVVGSGGNLFNLRSIFSKKGAVTSH